MVSRSNQANTIVMMNPYFTPKAPKPRMGVFDIVLRTLMGVIAVLMLGVGIWMAADASREKTVANHAAEREANELSQTNAAQVSQVSY